MLITKFNTENDASKLLEEDLNINLPEDYKKFLNKYNGGITYNTQAKIGKKWDNISGFYGVGDVRKGYRFNGLKSMGILNEYLEKQLLPVATNVGGDDYCISLNTTEYGVIYLVYHDLLGKKKRVFSSFTEFVGNIRSKEIGHIPTMEEREATAIANGFADEVELLRPIWREEIEKFSNLVQEEVILD